MTEREWREASDMRRASVSVAAIVLAAAALRFFGIGGAAAYTGHPAERDTVERAVAMMRAGTLHPQSFEQPPLYVYLQMGTAITRFLRGAAAGEWRSLDQVASDDFYAWGRAVTAALGTVTVLLVYLVGLRWGTRPALLGAGLMAVVPLHVRESQLALSGVPLACLVTLTFLLTLRAHERPRAVAFAAAGAAAGLTAATEYAGAVALILPLAAIWMTPGTHPSRFGAALAATGGAAGAFLLAAPYTLLDLPAFLNGFAAGIASGAADTSTPRLPLLLEHLRADLLWPAFLLLLGGIALAAVRAVRGPGRVRWTLALTFPVVYLSMLPRTALHSGRYLLPLLPFFCVLVGTAVVSGVSLLRRFAIPRALRTALIVALTVATLLPAAVASVRLARSVRSSGTIAMAYAWLQAHVPAGSIVAVESGRVVLPGARFRVLDVRELRERDRAEYARAGVDYLVASSDAYGSYLADPAAFTVEHSQYKRLFQGTREVARFSPSRERPGPELRILEVGR